MIYLFVGLLLAVILTLILFQFAPSPETKAFGCVILAAAITLAVIEWVL